VTLCIALVAWATPAAAGPASRGAPAIASAAVPNCQVGSPESIGGVNFVNGIFENGTWSYATGVACTANIADIALYEQLDFNGAKVNSAFKGFTGSARDIDAIISSYACSSCNGTWLFIWGQIMKAPSGISFTSPPSGCVVEDSGLYEVCVQTKSVTL
jgi:hypothetical protein